MARTSGAWFNAKMVLERTEAEINRRKTGKEKFLEDGMKPFLEMRHWFGLGRQFTKEEALRAFQETPAYNYLSWGFYSPDTLKILNRLARAAVTEGVDQVFVSMDDVHWLEKQNEPLGA